MILPENLSMVFAFFSVVDFYTLVRSEIRSEQIVISISLLNLHEVSARAHRSWEELEGKEMGFKHGQK